MNTVEHPAPPHEAALTAFREREGKPLFFADWKPALFLHFTVPAEALQPSVPLPLDCHKDRALVSLVAFSLSNFRVRGLGPAGAFLLRPFLASHFLNVRTYVRGPEGPGIFFLREYLSNPLSVPLGPPTFGLPYRHGRLRLEGKEGLETVDVELAAKDARIHVTATPCQKSPVARFVKSGKTRAGMVAENSASHEAACNEVANGPFPWVPGEPGSLAEFLLERYVAYTLHRQTLRSFRIWHPPWPQAVCETDWKGPLPDAFGGWAAAARFACAHLSPGVSGVWLGRPRRIAKTAEGEGDNGPAASAMRRTIPGQVFPATSSGHASRLGGSSGEGSTLHAGSSSEGSMLLVGRFVRSGTVPVQKLLQSLIASAKSAFGRTPVTADVFIQAPVDRVWDLSQDPKAHERWDIRFNRIRFLDKAEHSSQTFQYETSIGFGLKISGWGKTRPFRNRRGSALRFGSEDPKSLIREGSGSWQYEETARGTRFFTSYDYRTRFGVPGKVFDRLFFRPLMQWGTRWSFDRLRLWIERSIPPEVALPLWTLKFAARWTLGMVWIIEGLVPKVLFPHPEEIELVARSGLFWVSPETTLVHIGILQIAAGMLLLTGWRERLGAILSSLAILVLTGLVWLNDPLAFADPYGGIVKNLGLILCAAVIWILEPMAPKASRAANSNRTAQ